MSNHLSADSLMQHVRALAVNIGPRPAQATLKKQERASTSSRYLRQQGLGEPLEIGFETADSWNFTRTAAVCHCLRREMCWDAAKRANSSVGWRRWGRRSRYRGMFSAQKSPLQMLTPRKPTARRGRYASR
ncbi:MAG: hypothetical protein U0694_02165 [Anaerolineae bacterium]